MFSRAVVCLALLLFTLAASSAEKTLRRPPGTTRYGAMVTQLKSLAARSGGRLTLSSIGTSVKGRALWMATVQEQAPPAPQVWGEETTGTAPVSRSAKGSARSTASDIEHLPPKLGGVGGPFSPSRTILYICRLHGHEPASTEGALAFLKELTDAPDGSPLYQTLAHVTVYVVPMANPDGSEAFLRQNAHGQDLNRDWRTRTQPETQALYKAILRLKPDILTDQHELYPDDMRPDFTEAVSFGSGAPDRVSAFCDDSQSVVGAWMAAQGVPIVNHWVDDTRPARLTHRFCGVILGIPTLLFETNRLTGTGRSVAARARAHQTFMEAVLKLGAGERGQMLSEAATHGFLPRPKPPAPALTVDPEAAP